MAGLESPDPALRRNLHILMAGIATVGLQALMLSPMLTDIMRALAAGPAEVGVAAGSYGFGVAASAFLAAPKLDTWPKRRSLQLAFLVMSAALALCGLAWSWPVLVVGQFLIGAAGGIVIPGTYALAAELSAESYRTQALGRVVLGWSVALCAGVPLSAFLTDAMGWRTTFLYVAGLALAACLAYRLLPAGRPTGEERRVGYAQAVAAPDALVFLAATFAFMFAFYATYSFLGDHLRTLHAAGAWLGGLVAMSYGAGFGFGTVFDARINRAGPKRMVGPALAAIGFNYLMLPLAAHNLVTAVLYAFAWGAVAHLAMTSLVVSLSLSPPAVRGAVIALFSVITYLAQGVAGFLMGALYAARGFEAVSFTASAGAFVMAAVVLMHRRASG
jgi:MFS transporter, DHA1 family, inner membrane transport protein